mmetsp:Transcript_19113/g.59348  ORF Transcript_19113/g.59348 Transcript_19113/m.59348 type:complete len:212 (+) Transcript_19113:587-1222(+)
MSLYRRSHIPPRSAIRLSCSALERSSDNFKLCCCCSALSSWRRAWVTDRSNTSSRSRCAVSRSLYVVVNVSNCFRASRVMLFMYCSWSFRIASFCFSNEVSCWRMALLRTHTDPNLAISASSARFRAFAMSRDNCLAVASFRADFSIHRSPRRFSSSTLYFASVFCLSFCAIAFDSWSRSADTRDNFASSLFRLCSVTVRWRSNQQRLKLL